jgi:surfeit locus 1 family protein
MVRLRQFLVVLAGLAAAGAMVALGLWQMGVYRASGADSAADRAAAAPIPLNRAAPAGTRITDGYGRAVVFSGRYDPALQTALPAAEGPVGGAAEQSRVLTGFRLDDGRLLAVVRGITAGDPPAPPTGTIRQSGVLLPSENNEDPASSVRVPMLAQSWPGRLVEGYVNLSAAEAAQQGLDPAPLNLPPAPGRLRNGAYALQWWLFAGFAVLLAARIARDIGRGHELDLVAADRHEPSEPTGAPDPGSPAVPTGAPDLGSPAVPTGAPDLGSPAVPTGAPDLGSPAVPTAGSERGGPLAPTGTSEPAAHESRPQD